MPFDGTTTKTDAVLDQLREGRRRIAHRWHQGGYTDGHGGYCAVGALAFQHDLHNGTCRALTRALDQISEKFVLIGDWNDAEERTQADVLALYDRAIDLRIAELAGAGPESALAPPGMTRERPW